jgi:CarD family transcriptional regulator
MKEVCSTEVDRMFSTGEQVVYPNQGLARVEGIREIESGSGLTRFYVLRLEPSGSTVMVPVETARAVGLRSPIAAAVCERLLEVLAAPFAVPPAHWKDRQREYHEQTRRGDIFALAEVLKALTCLDARRPLPYSEKRLLERTRSLVVGEVAIASRRSEAEAEAVVDGALSTALPFTRTPRAA